MNLQFIIVIFFIFFIFVILSPLPMRNGANEHTPLAIKWEKKILCNKKPFDKNIKILNLFFKNSIYFTFVYVLFLSFILFILENKFLWNEP